MDEAVLRIVATGQDDGGGGQSTPGSAAPAAGGGSGGGPPPQQRTAQAALQQQTSPPAADKYLEVEAKAALQVAKKQQEQVEEARKAEIELEDRKRELLEIEARAALAVVRKQQEAAQAAADAQKAEAESVFDPVREAKKRHDSEGRQAQVDQAYKDLYGGDDEDTGLDKILDIASRFRGVMGGLGGAILGATLDVMAAVREAELEARNGGRRKPAAPATVPASPAGSAPPDATGSPVVPPVASAADGAAGTTEAAAGAEAAGTVAGAAAPLAAAAAPLAVAAAVIIGAAVVLKAAADELDKAVSRYADYSPEIAQAQAVVEVRRSLNDIRRAQQAGPELARYVEIQGKLQNDFEEIKIKLMTRLLTVVNPILEGLEKAMANADGMTGALLDIGRAISPIAGLFSELVNAKQDEKYRDIKDPTEIILHGPNTEPGSPIHTPHV